MAKNRNNDHLTGCRDRPDCLAGQLGPIDHHPNGNTSLLHTIHGLGIASIMPTGAPMMPDVPVTIHAGDCLSPSLQYDESGSRECLAPGPHTTGRAGPHTAIQVVTNAEDGAQMLCLPGREC